MSLKHIINRSKILNREALDNELVLPGEPLIYSIKYNIGMRYKSVQYFTNKKFRSLLKCSLMAHNNVRIPVVVIVKFYVSPPAKDPISAEDLRKEKKPATRSFEVCDYLLHFLEMLHSALFASYRQIVKIDAQKFYSKNPRTVMKFMRWEHYVDIQNNNTRNAKAQRKRKTKPVE